jgi:TET-Associated Glycosyltransferase
MLTALHELTADPVWIVRDDQAAEYEPDGHEIITYPLDWAAEYAAGHWTALEPYQPGAFLGAFPGREWACRTAGERGYWAVLQLDDNLTTLLCLTGGHVARMVADRHGGLSLFADMLAAVTLATNSRMTGAIVDSVAPQQDSDVLARAGFSYSLFLERCGEGREEWHGPYEDDILHAYQYGANAAAGTAAVLPWLRYKKMHGDASGMRSHYQHTRAAGLQRVAPEIAQLTVRKSYSNGRGSPRVFHTMLRGAIRTPLTVTDPGLYERVYQQAGIIAAEVSAGRKARIREKVERRAAAAARSAAAQQQASPREAS